MFVENGHNKQLLKNLVIKYNNKKNNKNNHENSTENRDQKNLKKLPWIPNISPKIKREFKKIGKDHLGLQNIKECHGQFDWLHQKTVRISP